VSHAGDAWDISEHCPVWYYTLLLVLPIEYDRISLHKVRRATLFFAIMLLVSRPPPAANGELKCSHI
jgi:hypothetical protein